MHIYINIYIYIYSSANLYWLYNTSVSFPVTNSSTRCMVKTFWQFIYTRLTVGLLFLHSTIHCRYSQQSIVINYVNDMQGEQSQSCRCGRDSRLKRTKDTIDNVVEREDGDTDLLFRVPSKITPRLINWFNRQWHTPVTSVGKLCVTAEPRLRRSSTWDSAYWTKGATRFINRFIHFISSSMGNPWLHDDQSPIHHDVITCIIFLTPMVIMLLHEPKYNVIYS